MKSNPFLSFSKKPPQQSNSSTKLSFVIFAKSILVALVFFMTVSFSYAQNLQTIASTTHEADRIEISEAYPNPATHYIQFDYRLTDRMSEGKITVFNLLGSVVGEHILNKYDNRLQIPVDNLKAGIYFYTISVNNKSLITKKFVVKH
ncbi:T9SS type A sorting domain-containing protein [Bernardetia sp. Wsw4-3y2]|uniref:T9SS type A sorting domain-containing protein n=1 Tax=unclassified Bernardetia TaxID=2647129 RepID=UPI0030CCDC16